MSRTSRLLPAALIALAAAFLVGPVHSVVQGAPADIFGQQADAALVARARGIHERVITADTHVDIGVNNFRPECNYTMRLTNQVNLPKMVEGGLDV